MEDRMSNSMSNRVANSNGVSNSNWVSNSMGNWMSNQGGVSNSMSNWVTNSMSNNSRSILRNSVICYILNNSITIVNIVNSLDPSIRKGNSVAARCGISISRLSLLEVISTVVILDSILISIHWGLSKVWGGIARASNKGASRGSGSNSYEGSNKNSLE